MKLISCYIENYGAISQRTFCFCDDVTTLCEDNGTGKTTLASFIKAMFYGLESYRSNAKEFCDRQHFYPFAGGAFGGNLTFEWDGHTYRIERFFGEKSETADKLTVLCDGVPTDRFGDDVGREIFGIDRQSFERTLFIDSAEMECATTADIGARLNRFLEGAGEDVNYDSAMALLEKAAATLKKTRGSGEIAAVKASIQDLEERIRNAERTQAGLAAKYETYDAISLEIDTLDAQVERARAANELLAKWEQYEYICDEVERAKCAKEALLQKYPAGLPEEESVRACMKEAAAEREAVLMASATKLDEQEAAVLSRLSMTFAAGVPDEETLDDREQVAHKLASLDAQITALEKTEQSERERLATTRLGGRIPTDDDVAAIKQKTEEYRTARVAWEAEPDVLDASEAVGSKKKTWHLPVAIAAALVMLVGVGLLFVSPIAGGVVAALGGVTLLLDAFLYLNGRTGAVVATARENPVKLRLLSDMRAAEDAVRAALAAHGYVASEGVEIAFYRFSEDAQVCASFAQRDGERRAKLALANEERDMLVAALCAFLAQYALSGEAYVPLLSRLRADRTQYLALRKKESEITKRQAELAQLRDALRAKIQAYAAKYGEAALDTEQTLADIAAWQSLERTVREGEARANEYRVARGLEAKPEAVPVDVDAALARLAALRDEKSRRLRDIEQDESDADVLEVYRNEREQAREHLAALEARYRVLSATMTMLGEADRALKERYVSPVKDRFTFYSDLIERAIGERVMLSGNFEITFDMNGRQRSEKHLSAGQRSICALCFRLALIENMYGGEIPFLVMDDPFLAMDETHLLRVRDVLQEVAKKTQILYLTCHPSRKM